MAVWVGAWGGMVHALFFGRYPPPDDRIRLVFAFFQYPPNDRIKVAFALLWRISVWIVGFALLWPTAGQAARKINDAGRDYVDANQIMAGLLGPGKKLYLMNYKTCRAHLNNRPLPSTLPEMLPSCSMIPHNLFQLCSLKDFRFIINASRRFLQRRLT